MSNSLFRLFADRYLLLFPHDRHSLMKKRKQIQVYGEKMPAITNKKPLHLPAAPRALLCRRARLRLPDRPLTGGSLIQKITP